MSLRTLAYLPTVSQYSLMRFSTQYGGGGIRTHGTRGARRFSRPVLSTTQPPHRSQTAYHDSMGSRTGNCTPKTDGKLLLCRADKVKKSLHSRWFIWFLDSVDLRQNQNDAGSGGCGSGNQAMPGPSTGSGIDNQGVGTTPHNDMETGLVPYVSLSPFVTLNCLRLGAFIHGTYGSRSRIQRGGAAR